MNMNQDMSIVIITCDAYIDVMQEYMRYFRMNWKDCPFELIVVTEDVDINDERARCITAGKGTEWTQRAIIGIEAASTPYVLMSMDDGFISEPVDTDDVLGIIQFLKDNHIKYYRNPKRKYDYKDNPVFDDNANVYKIKKNLVYGIDFGHNIWEKNTIRELLGDGSRSAWQIEEYLNEIALNSEPGYYDDYVSDKRNFLNIVETVSGGKWMPKEIKKLELLGIPANLGNRGILPWTDTFRRNLHAIAYKIVPQKHRKAVKKVFSKLGYKFVTKN